MSGVPFVKEARQEKNFDLISKSESKILISFSNVSYDVPYSDCFQIKEHWAIIGDKSRCIWRLSSKTEMIKSTLFKG